MAKRNGYPLPLVNDPEGHLCVLVKVPNDRNHIRAFWGHLFELTYYWSWERDEAHNGADAAARWMEVWHESLDLWQSTEGACDDVVPGCAEMIYGIRTVGCELQVHWANWTNWANWTGR